MGYKKGKDWTGNRKGRPKQAEIHELRTALNRAKVSMNKDLLDSIIERAYKSDTLAKAVMDKLFANKSQVDANVTGDVTIIRKITKTYAKPPK